MEMCMDLPLANLLPWEEWPFGQHGVTAEVGDWDEAMSCPGVRKGRFVGSTGDEMECGKEGCHRCSATELEMILGD